MPLIQQRMGILRNQTQPGDIVLKLYPRSNLGAGWNKWGSRNPIGALIKSLSAKNDEYGHGGLAVGPGKLVEVNGGLPKDSLGKSRLMANIYVTDLEKDTRSDSYDVFRCVDSELAERVAIEAFPFAAQGKDKSWNYNLTDALKSTGHGKLGRFLSMIGMLSDTSGNSPVPEGYQVMLEEGATALDVANLEKRQFFCTQFVVWLYNLVAEKECGRFPVIPLRAADAYPGALAEALNRSGIFYYAGSIRGLA